MLGLIPSFLCPFAAMCSTCCLPLWDLSQSHFAIPTSAACTDVMGRHMPWVGGHGAGLPLTIPGLKNIFTIILACLEWVSVDFPFRSPEVLVDYLPPFSYWFPYERLWKTLVPGFTEVWDFQECYKTKEPHCASKRNFNFGHARHFSLR